MSLFPIKDLVPKTDVTGGSPKTPPGGIPRAEFHREFGEIHSGVSGIQLNTNTYMSFGLIAVLCGGIWAILNAINSAKSEISATRMELIARFDKLEGRVSTIETAKNSWTGVDMFKWTVHLQQANPSTPGFTLKVPEPEIRQ